MSQEKKYEIRNAFSKRSERKPYRRQTKQIQHLYNYNAEKQK